jgi:hypothetical protein
MGAGYGTSLLPIMVTSKIGVDEMRSLEAISSAQGVVTIRILQTDSERTTAASNERKLRGGDRSFETLFMIEAFDEDAAKQAGKEVSQNHFEATEREVSPNAIGVFSQIFGLNA